jgi:hypothetical protein
VFTTSVFTAFAQGGANKAYTVNNLSPELNEITENVKKEAKLNADQFTKFKNDYVLFLNENAKPKCEYARLILFIRNEIQRLYE